MYYADMSDEDFENLISEALLSLPREFAEKLENVSIASEAWPDPNQLRKVGFGSQGMLLGLYEGIPHTKRAHYGIGGALPDKITIFKIPLLSVSHSIDHLKENIRDTVMHEIGHHFGMSEEQIRKATKKE